MLGIPAGIAALAGWAATVGREVDAIYLAFDLDCLDAAGGWAVTMPETGGLSLPTALAAVRTLASAIPVAGFGATAVTLANGDEAKTVDAIAQLAEAAFATG
jgi:arginase family enzyme